MRIVTDEQRRARIALRHGLAAAHRYPDIASATRAITAWHATDPGTVHLAIHARVQDVAVDDVERELNEARSLVKQLAMRRTLWAFPRGSYAAVLASSSARVAAAHRSTWHKRLVDGGVTDDPESWLATAGREVLDLLADGQPRSSTEVADAIPQLARRLELSPGTTWAATVSAAPNTLTMLAAEGAIVRAANGGHWRLSKPTWTLPKHWLGDVDAPMSASQGWDELVAGYLHTFAPATEDDIVWWLGATKSIVRAALKDIGAEEVRLEDGRTAYLGPGDRLDDTANPDPWAAITPTLDPTTMGWKHRDFYLSAEDRPFLVDSVGNAAMTAWVDGRIVGGWAQDEAGRVHVVPRRTLPASRQRPLDEEAERLTAYLDGTIIPTPYGKRIAAGERLA